MRRLTKLSFWLAASIGFLVSLVWASARTDSAEEQAEKIFAADFVSRDFNGTDTRALILKKGTEVNVVIDYQCLRRLPGTRVRASFLFQEGLISETALSAKDSPEELSAHWALPEDIAFADLKARVDGEACLVLASPDGNVYPLAYTRDPYVNVQRHFQALKVSPQVRKVFVDSPLAHLPRVIAIVDTGVDLAHEDLKENIWSNPLEVAGNGIDDDGNGFIDDVNGWNFASGIADPRPEGNWPDNRHGTHVAGLAAARADNGIGGTGIHGFAKIMAVNVFGRSPFAKSSTLENAIRYAASNGADVINLSLGGHEYSRSMRRVLRSALTRGVFIVAAAGNEAQKLSTDSRGLGYVSPAVYGASFRGMLTVGSVDAFDGRLSSFSNFNPQLVEIAAPGAHTSKMNVEGLFSTEPSDSYGMLAGTSMAAPLVSGAAALVKSWLISKMIPPTPEMIEATLIRGSTQQARLSKAISGGRVLDLEKLAHE